VRKGYGQEPVQTRSTTASHQPCSMVVYGGCIHSEPHSPRSQFDGYNYHFQMDYPLAWARAVESYRAVCDACPDIKVSLEFKPTDEAARFSITGSTGEALLMAQVLLGGANTCWCDAKISLGDTLRARWVTH
jgi:hypothetical protein